MTDSRRKGKGFLPTLNPKHSSSQINYSCLEIARSRALFPPKVYPHQKKGAQDCTSVPALSTLFPDTREDTALVIIRVNK